MKLYNAHGQPEFVKDYTPRRIEYEYQKDYSKLVLLIATIILVLVGLLIVKVSHAYALGNDNPTIARYGGCTPYVHSMVIYSNTGFSHTAVLQHSKCAGSETLPKAHKQGEKDTTNPVVNSPSSTVITSNQLTNDDPHKEVKHPNCGRGNGSELDSNGNDVDPGNSGEHNHGGD